MADYLHSHTTKFVHNSMVDKMGWWINQGQINEYSLNCFLIIDYVYYNMYIDK